MSAVVTASRRHVEREMRRVEVAKRMKRMRGMAVMAVCAAMNVYE